MGPHKFENREYVDKLLFILVFLACQLYDDVEIFGENVGTRLIERLREREKGRHGKLHTNNALSASKHFVASKEWRMLPMASLTSTRTNAHKITKLVFECVPSSVRKILRKTFETTKPGICAQTSESRERKRFDQNDRMNTHLHAWANESVVNRQQQRIEC